LHSFPAPDYTKKEILIFIDWYLPGYKGGGPIRSIANLISHFEEDVTFSIITRNTDYCETIPYKKIVPNQWIDIGSGNRAFYFSEKKLGFKAIRKLLIENPNSLVYLNSMFSWYFTLLPLVIIKTLSNHRVILAPRGMLSSGSFKVKKIKKSLFLIFAKIFGLYKNVVFQATSEDEMKDVLAHKLSKKQPVFAPNLPSKNTTIKNCNLIKEAGKVNLVSIARIAPEKNLLYALQVLKKVKGNIKFDIYGVIYDLDYWSLCENLINVMPTNIAVHYHGDLPSDSIEEVLCDSHFLFMPTTGENFGHIILQSLIASCPPIISDKTPWNKLNSLNAGFSIPLDDISEWIGVIESCIAMVDGEYKIMRKQAGSFAKTYVNDQVPLDINKKLFL